MIASFTPLTMIRQPFLADSGCVRSGGLLVTLKGADLHNFILRQFDPHRPSYYGGQRKSIIKSLLFLVVVINLEPMAGVPGCSP